ncbi:MULTISPECIES: 5-oxoprolinase subunit B family protein [unclassified Leifsonia]|uniref:5-oxoprolinase subunit B family protein n=1 Tax=unclassified Leifsonia TaxID=2663824 RepID=UPI0006FB50EA|nr:MULTISPECIES: allophanate hydrolase subunit 1 [unclassified Leifsonia]KQX07972.1 allophanate hydrolase [Leifsonia sp. Root1293]KRA12253.1 allophanate hydrolase [Leifsonia sp. Root60]
MSPPDAAPPVAEASLRFLPTGDRALLVELESLDAVLALHEALELSRPSGVIDLVPAARTVLVTVDPAQLTLSEARRWIMRAATARPADAAAPTLAPVVIPVRYDGPDLESVATVLGLRPADLIERHVAATWRVAFTGFAPGFGYLTSTQWTHDVPRLASPRTLVPAGSVGLAGEFGGVYPRSSPGGWQLIGTTEAVLWDSDAMSPALLVPGGTVRFEAVT